MKVTISNTLVTALSASAANLAIHIQGQRSTHPYLKSVSEKRAEEHAKNFKVSIEEARKQTGFQFPFQSLIDVIESKTRKFGTLTKTAEGIEFEINDNFLIESVDTANALFIKLLKPAADIMGIVSEHQIIVDQFNQRWEDEVTDLTHIQLSSAPAHLKINDPVVEASSWTLKESGTTASPYFLDTENENFIDIYFGYWINGIGQELKIAPNTTKGILTSKRSLRETAQASSLPASLVNTIRQHYNFPLLTNTSSAQAEVQEVTVKTDVEQTDQVAAE